MALIDQFNQAGAVDVRVNLRRRDIGMAEQGLEGSEIGAARQQVGRERMAQDMRADPVRGDAGVGGERANDLE